MKQLLTREIAELQIALPIRQIVNDEIWYKVVIHGVPTAIGYEEGPEKVRYEVETFNQGLKVVGTPRWLTAREKFDTQLHGSLLVAFATEDEACRAIHKHLWVGAKSVKVEKALPRESTAKTTRTTKEMS